MDFWGTFWATVCGAVVGASAAWLFSLQLQGRQKRHEDEVRRSEARRIHLRDLDSAVGDVIRLIGEYDAAISSFAFAYGPPSQLKVETPHAARARLVSAIRIAQIAAEGSEEAPVEATFEVVTSRPQNADNDYALNLTHAAHHLALWRRGKLTAEQAVQAIRHRPGPETPDTPS